MDQAPFTSPLQTPPEAKPQKSAGPLIGAVIVILVLALGALYVWGAQLNEKNNEIPYIPGDEEQSAINESWLPESSNSDDAAAIEAELEATNIDAFEQEMNADLEATETSL